MEEYEDELIEFFSREADNVKDKLCSKRTGKLLPLYCLSSQPFGSRHIPYHVPLPPAPNPHPLKLAQDLASVAYDLGTWVLPLHSLPVSFQNLWLSHLRYR